MEAPTVFISYSHKDEGWKNLLVTHLGVLKCEGLLDIWDDTLIETGDEWYPEIQKAIGSAKVAILLISANFLTSKFILTDEVPRLLQRRRTEGLRIIPVIIKPCAWKRVEWLSRIQVKLKDGNPLSGGSEYAIDSVFAEITSEIGDIIGQAWRVTIELEKISLSKLPSTNPQLFGRENEITLLNQAWDDPHTNIVSLVAWGGVGKTALTHAWLNRMRADQFRGAERVFGWSFYSQGAREGAQVSADEFIAAALKWFGDPDPKEGSPWDKAERLANLIRQQRTLLILDGVEPLQSPFEQGHIKDPGLCCLVKELAAGNNGLCVLTTRLKVDDIEHHIGSSVRHVSLEHLSDEAGAQLLKQLGVNGSDDELKLAAREYDGHALALTLLGRYLTIAHDGNIGKRDRIPRLTDEPQLGAHARRVMESYERLFKDKPELDILQIMGLFDRPADAGAVAVLRAKPVIKGLTNRLLGLSQDKWGFSINNLRRLRLLALEDPYRPGTLDCHPLVREYFGEKLQKHNPKAWKEAHSRLYQHYKSVAKELPDTIEEMAPLYAAVAHGCHAGRYQETFDEVYWRRIARGNEYFATTKLGTIGAELALLSGFFDPPWSKPVADLRESSKSLVLGEIGFDLRALGRLGEAVQPMEAALQSSIARKHWQNVAKASGNLSELFLTIGDLPQALKYAQESVEYADRSGDEFERISMRTTLADALHQAGRLSEAEVAFREAEKMQKERQAELPLLYSLGGYRYCDLLLSQGKYREVQRRAEQILEWSRRARGVSLLDTAVVHLSLGAACLRARQEATTDFTHAASHLNQAVDGLRKAGQQDDLPRGLLARAELYRVTKEFKKAQKDLDEAMTITTRGQMRLYEADCHLEQARLHLAMGNKDEARKSHAKAKEMIEEMGYHRRDKEVKEIGKQLA